MNTQRCQLVIAILSITLLTHCAPSRGTATAQPTEISTTSPVFNTPENPIEAINTPDDVGTTSASGKENRFVVLARSALAQQLGIEPGQIQLLKVTDIDWQDLTLGCKPGDKLVKTRLTGYRIWLEANGVQYVYHVGLDDNVYMCPA